MQYRLCNLDRHTGRPVFILFQHIIKEVTYNLFLVCVMEVYCHNYNWMVLFLNIR